MNRRLLKLTDFICRRKRPNYERELIRLHELTERYLKYHDSLKRNDIGKLKPLRIQIKDTFDNFKRMLVREESRINFNRRIEDNDMIMMVNAITERKTQTYTFSEAMSIHQFANHFLARFYIYF